VGNTEREIERDRERERERERRNCFKRNAAQELLT
jgi:hypothetical protein